MKKLLPVFPGIPVWLYTGLALSILPLLCLDNPFFGDTVLYARQADWYLNAGFSSLILPSEIDAGHPPFFAILLALCWKICGQSLWTGHVLMLPVLIWLAREVQVFAENFLPGTGRLWALALFLLEPVLLAQSTLYSNDILMTAAFFGAINAYPENKGWKLGVCLCISGLVSLRGIMIMPAIVLFGWIYYRNQLLNIRFVSGMILCTSPVVGWMLWHYFQTGWLTSPVSKNWNTQHGFTDMDGIVHNILSIGFRFVDQGRGILWIVLGAGFIFGKKLSSKIWDPVLVLFLLSTGVLCLWFIPFANPPGHRYFLTEFILFALIAGSMAAQMWSGSWTLFTIMAGALVSGHFWIYPDSVAKGWDSTLAYLPWSGYRTEAVAYMKQQHIPPDQVGSAFPLVHSGRYTHLNGENWQFAEKDVESQVYILYSNLCNGFSEKEIQILEKYWDVEKSWGTWPVRMVLYRNPEQIPAIPSGTEMVSIEP